MRKLALTLTALVFCGVVAYAGPESIRSSSKEMKETVAPAPPACDFSWTGFYLGLNGGGAWSDGDTRFTPEPSVPGFFGGRLEPTSLDPDIDGGFIGGQLGFNWQAGRWFVFGVETDFQGGDISGEEVRFPVPAATGFPPNGPDTFYGTSERLNWFGTFRGRLGVVPFCRLLIYGTGGLAYGDADYAGVVNYVADGGPFFYATRSETNVGWTGGGGLEFAISRHWTIKAEYLFVDLGDQGASAPPTPLFFRGPANEAVHFNWDTQFHTIKGGLNFKF
jgi:outer membrane immunogenic protein